MFGAIGEGQMHFSNAAVVELKEVVIASIRARDGRSPQPLQHMTFADFAHQLLGKEAPMFWIINGEPKLGPIGRHEAIP
jgi:hypothetical protein